MNVTAQASSEPADKLIGVAVRDLMFQSRITRVCKDLALPYEVVRDLSSAAPIRCRRLIVDLSLAGAVEWIQRLKRSGPTEVIGFVSHTDVQTIAQARSAGVDRVLSRGAFSRQIAEILRGDLPQEGSGDAGG